MVVTQAKRYASQLGSRHLRKLKIRRVEPVVKADIGQDPSKFQIGTWVADKLCSHFDEIEALRRSSKIQSHDMSEVVRRTTQRSMGNRSKDAGERKYSDCVLGKPKLAEDCTYPDSMLVKGTPLAKKKYKNPPFEPPKHLYVNEKGTFWDYPQSGWEAYVVKKFCDDAKTVGWIRNLPKKPWSLAVSYDKGGVYAPTFPDYVVFSEVNGSVFPSIIDPHNEAYEDSENRAIGLATYAEQHGDQFHQILLITKEGEKYRTVDLNRTDVRTRVYKAQSRADIGAIRKDLGFDY